MEYITQREADRKLKEQARKDQAELKRLLGEAKIVSAKKADRAAMKMALVEAVAIYPFLYDKSDPGYKKITTLARETWMQIESQRLTGCGTVLKLRLRHQRIRRRRLDQRWKWARK